MDLESKLLPLAHPLLQPGEELLGVGVATQARLFTGRQVLLAVTDGRLLVQGLNRKFESAGDVLSLNPARIARVSVDGAGGGWMSVGMAILDSAAVTIKIRTTDSQKLKLMMMRGTGVFGELGGGETQRRCIEALSTWFRTHAR